MLVPLGALAAGTLLDCTSERATIAVFSAFGLVQLVWAPQQSIT